jgi:hypothetical protein
MSLPAVVRLRAPIRLAVAGRALAAGCIGRMKGPGRR